MTFLSVTTLTAGFLSVKNNFWPMATGPNEALHFQGMVNTTLTITMMVLVVIILGAAVRKWIAVGKTGVDPDSCRTGVLERPVFRPARTRRTAGQDRPLVRNQSCLV